MRSLLVLSSTQYLPEPSGLRVPVSRPFSSRLLAGSELLLVANILLSYQAYSVSHVHLL